MANRLRERYTTEVVPALIKQFEYGNPNQVPQVDKIVVNIGLGEALTNAKAIDAAVGDLAIDHRPEADRHPGQAIDRPVPAADGQPDRRQGHAPRRADVGLPRPTDVARPAPHPRLPWHPVKSFDGRGNYSLGLREQLAFPEIDYDKVDRLRGLEISIVTTAKTDEESKKPARAPRHALRREARGGRHMAKKSMIAKAKRTPKHPVAGVSPLLRVRPAAGLHASVRAVPDLLPGACAPRRAARRDEVELVGHR